MQRTENTSRFSHVGATASKQILNVLDVFCRLIEGSLHAWYAPFSYPLYLSPSSVHTAVPSHDRPKEPMVPSEQVLLEQYTENA